MAKRVGLARIEKMIEALKREIDLTSTTLKAVTVTEGGTARAKVNTGSITAGSTLLESNSGTVYVLANDDYTIQLPTLSDSTGVTYTFILGADITNDIFIDSTASNGFRGAIFGPAAETLNNRYLKLVGGTATRGDQVTVWCDGSRYWVRGFQRADNSIIGDNSG